MTKQSEKPREFWVYKDEVALVVREARNPNAVIEEVHVIEYSAYQSALDEIDKLKRELCDMKDQLFDLQCEARERDEKS